MEFSTPSSQPATAPPPIPINLVAESGRAQGCVIFMKLQMKNKFQTTNHKLQTNSKKINKKTKTKKPGTKILPGVFCLEFRSL